MGLFDRFLRRPRVSELMRVRVSSDASGSMWVEIEPQRKDLQDAEYLFLPLYYTSKVMFNFDPRSPDMQLAATMLIHCLEQCLDSGLDTTTDLFECCELSDVVQYSRVKRDKSNWTARIHLSWIGLTTRGITTDFPLRTTTQQTAFSVIAVLQACLDRMDETGKHLCQSAFEYMIDEYNAGADYSSITTALRLPSIAYIQAFSK